MTVRTTGRVRHALLASAVMGVAVTLTACSSGADAPDDTTTLGIHGVMTTYVPPLANPDLTAEEALAALGVEASDSATAAMEWFIAGDCAVTAPTTEDFTVACDDSGTLYLLEPASLTEADVESASVLESGGVTVTFTDTAAADLARLTARAATAPPPTNQIAVVVDGVVVTAPAVQEEITTGAVQITSSDQTRDWAALAAALSAGAAG